MWQWFYFLLVQRVHAEGAQQDHEICAFALPMINMSKKCPDSSEYWESPRKTRKLIQSPDCRHEIGIQLSWQRMSRWDFSRGKVKTGSSYRIKVFRAGRNDIFPVVSEFQLQKLTVSWPGRFVVNGSIYTSLADLSMHFEDVSASARMVELVLPMRERGDSSNDSSKQSSHLVTWLSRAGKDNDVDCSWWSWITHWFMCPTYPSDADILHDKHVVHKKELMQHFVSRDCAETFVLSSVGVITFKQLRHLQSLPYTRQVNRGTQHVTPEHVATGFAMLSENTFTVFNAEEIWTRRVQFGYKFAIGVCCMILLFLIVHQCLKINANSPAFTALATTEEGSEADVSVVNEVDDKFTRNGTCVAVMIVDHWVSYIVSATLVIVAYQSGLLNRRTGVPWEHHQVFGVWLLLHSVHELYWFSKTGKLAQNVSRIRVVKGCVVGPIAELDYYLDMQFIAIAFQFGSQLAYWSLAVLIASNGAAQLCLSTYFAYASYATGPGTGDFFKARGFEVMHTVLEESQYLAKVGGSKITVAFFAVAKFLLEDLLQAIIQCLFTKWYGGSAVVYASVSVSLGLSLLGALESVKHCQ